MGVAYSYSLAPDDAYSLLVRTTTNLKPDPEQFMRSNAPTTRPLISVRRAET